MAIHNTFEQHGLDWIDLTPEELLVITDNTEGIEDLLAIARLATRQCLAAHDLDLAEDAVAYASVDHIAASAAFNRRVAGHLDKQA